MTPIKAIIFDLDGTLIDTLDDISAALNHALSSTGFDGVTREQTRQFVGRGVRELIKSAAPTASAEQREGILVAYMAHYSKGLMNCTRPYEGIIDAVNRLSKAGFMLAVLSNKPHKQTRRLAEAFFGEGVFAAICGQREDMRRKPDPQVPLLICEQLGVAASEAVFVGDSETDIQTGRNAGMRTYGVTWGFRSAQVLMAEGADFVVGSPCELAELIMKTRGVL